MMKSRTWTKMSRLYNFLFYNLALLSSGTIARRRAQAEKPVSLKIQDPQLRPGAQSPEKTIGVQPKTPRPIRPSVSTDDSPPWVTKTLSDLGSKSAQWEWLWVKLAENVSSEEFFVHDEEDPDHALHRRWALPLSPRESTDEEEGHGENSQTAAAARTNAEFEELAGDGPSSPKGTSGSGFHSNWSSQKHKRSSGQPMEKSLKREIAETGRTLGKRDEWENTKSPELIVHDAATGDVIGGILYDKKPLSHLHKNRKWVTSVLPHVYGKFYEFLRRTKQANPKQEDLFNRAVSVLKTSPARHVKHHGLFFPRFLISGLQLIWDEVALVAASVASGALLVKRLEKAIQERDIKTIFDELNAQRAQQSLPTFEEFARSSAEAAEVGADQSVSDLRTTPSRAGSIDFTKYAKYFPYIGLVERPPPTGDSSDSDRDGNIRVGKVILGIDWRSVPFLSNEHVPNLRNSFQRYVMREKQRDHAPRNCPSCAAGTTSAGYPSRNVSETWFFPEEQDGLEQAASCTEGASEPSRSRKNSDFQVSFCPAPEPSAAGRHACRADSSEERFMDMKPEIPAEQALLQLRSPLLKEHNKAASSGGITLPVFLKRDVVAFSPVKKEQENLNEDCSAGVVVPRRRGSGRSFSSAGSSTGRLEVESSTALPSAPTAGSFAFSRQSSFEGSDILTVRDVSPKSVLPGAAERIVQKTSSSCSLCQPLEPHQFFETQVTRTEKEDFESEWLQMHVDATTKLALDHPDRVLLFGRPLAKPGISRGAGRKLKRKGTTSGFLTAPSAAFSGVSPVLLEAHENMTAERSKQDSESAEENPLSVAVAGSYSPGAVETGPTAADSVDDGTDFGLMPWRVVQHQRLDQIEGKATPTAPQLQSPSKGRYLPPQKRKELEEAARRGAALVAGTTNEPGTTETAGEKPSLRGESGTSKRPPQISSPGLPHSSSGEFGNFSALLGGMYGLNRTTTEEGEQSSSSFRETQKRLRSPASTVSTRTPTSVWSPAACSSSAPSPLLPDSMPRTWMLELGDAASPPATPRGSSARDLEAREAKMLHSPIKEETQSQLNSPRTPSYGMNGTLLQSFSARPGVGPPLGSEAFWGADE
ncbi:unnamed protein product [Amoebophrya sp. A120]|nr:unnamed protein product [Amoebophrya sp. A120]|eukprot:GSA120T00003020001.1